ncbi:MAG: hypothetical protein OXK78_16950 [Caldilineaceae bacterium]|nr:hypothetical protein [Caldilineaceae bacterium]
MQTTEDALEIGSEPQLFVDDTVIGAKHGVVRTLHPARKLEEPVLRPDRPWEGRRVYIYGSVYYDDEAQLYRMWYITRLGQGQQPRAPGLRGRTGDIVLYAESADGVHWEKPSLGRHEFDGSRENNILFFDKHSPTVIVDADALPEYRFKMAAWNWDQDASGYWIAHSADGLNWREYDVNPILMRDEILESVTVARHPRTGEYFAFHRLWGEVRGHVRRLVAVATSRDFITWTSHGVCLVPDELDDAWAEDPGQRAEFYGMSGFVYGGQFLGFLPVFDVIKDARGESGMPASVAADGSKGLHAPAVISESGAEIDQAPWDGPIAAQLVHSRDGLSWHRFEDRSPIIPRGEPGSFDAGCILCSADRPLIRGDEVWHYYTAVSTMHGGPMPPKTISIGLAKWRLDGFVSLDAGHFGGVVETVPLQLSGEGLEVNVDAGDGSLAVEVLSAACEPLPGFTRVDCQAIDTDGVRQTVRWSGDARLPIGQPLRLRFHLQDAELYSFRIREAGQP